MPAERGGDVTALADRVRGGDTRALARAITLVENDIEAGRALIAAFYHDRRESLVIGVTGPPGAGKSTLVDQLVRHARQLGHRLGVLAVDPTSAFTGGAILGDRVRMGGHAADDDVFIRSMATRGQLGGLARATEDAAVVLAAAGKDVIVIETVGVGQDEIDVAGAADVSVVVLVPGAGDDVQAIKAGIMEIADIFVVNKADRDGAERLAQSIELNLSLHTFAAGAWRPPVLKTVATSGDGIAPLWASIVAFDTSGPQRASRRRAGAETSLRRALSAAFLRRAGRVLPSAVFARAVDQLAAREVDPYSTAEDLLQMVLEERSPAEES